MLNLDTTRRLVKMRTISHRLTFALGTRFPRAIPLVFVVGYPKSGTTWVCQIVADYLQLPFPRYSILPVGCPAVVHGHECVSPRFPHGVYVMRDGRDVLTSMYFMKARELPEGDNPKLTRAQRRMFPGLVNRDHVADNIAAFIQEQMRHPHASPVKWGDHVMAHQRANNPGIVTLRYEDLLRDGENTFAQAMTDLSGRDADRGAVHATLEKFSFAQQSGRKTGDDNRSDILRKGEIGDWKNHFTRESAEIFDHHCGEALVATGYQPDRSWVTAFQPSAHAPSDAAAEATS